MINRNEYPRPQFKNDEWLPLNGIWKIHLSNKYLSLKEVNKLKEEEF